MGKIITAILTKNDMIASIIANTTTNIITRGDPRNGISVQVYYNVFETMEWFEKSIDSSIANGWALKYKGGPLEG